LKISAYPDPNLRPVKTLSSTVPGTHRSKDPSNNDAANRAFVEQGGQGNLDRENVERQVIKAIELANKSYVSRYTRLEFSIHEKTKEIEYKGDFAEIQYEVSPGVKMTINASQNAFQLYEEGGEVKSKVYDTLIELAQRMRAGDASGISNRLGEIDARIDGVLAERSSLGAKSNRMETALQRSLNSQYEFTKILSRLEDTDYARAMIDFSVQEAAYHAAIKSGSQILQPTLLDFLK